MVTFKWKLFFVLSPAESPEMLVAGGSAGWYNKFYLKQISDILWLPSNENYFGFCSPVESPEMLAPCNQQYWQSLIIEKTSFQPL